MAVMYSTDGGTGTNTVVWKVWNQSTSTSNAATTDTCWPLWCENTTASTSSNIVWIEWANVAGRTYRQAAPTPAPAETAEQKAEREARLVEYKRKQDEERKAREEAAKRAETLLHENLSQQQRKEFEKKKEFHVIAASGRRYRVKFATHGNVEELNAQGKAHTRYCIQPSQVPTGDAVLAQKLMLETDEAAFHKIANATRLMA